MNEVVITATTMSVQHVTRFFTMRFSQLFGLKAPSSKDFGESNRLKKVEENNENWKSVLTYYPLTSALHKPKIC